jgi:hypothetical protein
VTDQSTVSDLPLDYELLTDEEEILFRQVIPEWIDTGIPSSQAFTPTRKDLGQLSIARSSLTTAEAAYKHYTAVLNLASAGVWGITVGEATEVGLKCYDAPDNDVPAHGFIDFRTLGRKAAVRSSKLLAAHARTRGRLYP